MKTITIIATCALLALLASCAGIHRQAAAVTLTSAQFVMQGYSFHAGGRAEGVITANSTFLAVDANVDLEVTYRAPDPATGIPRVVWTRQFQRDAGQRAYRVEFSAMDGESFVVVRRVPWEEARAGLPWLPAPRGDDVPFEEEVSTPVPVAPPPRPLVEPEA